MREYVVRESPLGDGLREIAEVEEVVRCRDCAMCAATPLGLACTLRRSAGSFLVGPMDFCSKGERVSRP